MEISQCHLLPNVCYHYPKCFGVGGCKRIGGRKCVHAVIYEGQLQVVEGKELYKLIDKDHPEYDHLYKMYNEEYLDVLRQAQIENNIIRRQEYEKEKEVRKANELKAKKDAQAFYLYQASKTSELKISRV
jgi:hypothetical protein